MQRNVYDRRALDYDDVAVVAHEIGSRLLERLNYLLMKPLMILDLGCATGALSAQLKKRYPQATIVGLDVVWSMLAQAQKKQGFLKKWPLVCSDMKQLPFASCCFDMIIANQSLCFVEDLAPVMGELYRVLKVNGCLMFSTLGPDTLQEIHAHIPELSATCVDMHVIGDLLLAQQFVDPVVDVEYLTAQHSNVDRMKAALGAYGIDLNLEGALDLTYEIIYGHAWKGEPKQLSKGGETFIPVSSLLGRR
ncbi:MAG: methyltransferase domain-containing protein [Legionellaceae bacterium]